MQLLAGRMKDRPLWSSHKRISHNHFKIWHKSLNNFYFLFGQILLASFSWSLYISIKSLGWGPLTLEDSWQHQTFDQTEAEAVDEWQTSAKKAATNHCCKKSNKSSLHQNWRNFTKNFSMARETGVQLCSERKSTNKQKRSKVFGDDFQLVSFPLLPIVRMPQKFGDL